MRLKNGRPIPSRKEAARGGASQPTLCAQIPFPPIQWWRRTNQFAPQAKREHILGASIRGQCAKHKFYSDGETEPLFGAIEGEHSKVLKFMSDVAWSRTNDEIEPFQYAQLLQAVLFQRSRTALEVHKETRALEAMVFQFFGEYVKNAPETENREWLLQSLANGSIGVSIGQRWMTKMAIVTTLNCGELISDLDFHFLRNQTDLPFIFSDSPVVFCNTYYQNVKDRGVLGLQTPGLQIFYPIDEKTTVMFIDDRVYHGAFREPMVIDVIERCDVSQLNALQLHHSMDAVYFGNKTDKAYVFDLWNAHKFRIIVPKNSFKNREGWTVKGEVIENGLYQIFEPHLNFKLSLSFIDCNPVRPEHYQSRHRSPQLYEEHLERKAKEKLVTK